MAATQARFNRILISRPGRRLLSCGCDTRSGEGRSRCPEARQLRADADRWAEVLDRFDRGSPEHAAAGRQWQAALGLLVHHLHPDLINPGLLEGVGCYLPGETPTRQDLQLARYGGPLPEGYA